MEWWHWVGVLCGAFWIFGIGWLLGVYSIAKDKSYKKIPEGHTVISNLQLQALFNSVPTSVKISLANQSLKEDDPDS